MKTIIEPFRIKTVEPIRMTTREQRLALIKAANYNLFALKSEDVIIDLLTDSGTSAMSTQQWSALMRGDESYAGSPSFYNFEQAVKELMPFKHVIPTHQGRAAEAIVVSIFGGENKIVPNNTHFDTTRANFESAGVIALDLVIEEGKDPACDHPFKGNMDLEKLDQLLREKGDEIPLVMTTVTNNAGGGQPVSMANIRATKELCEKYGKPFFIDSCRFAENAYFIKIREEGFGDKSVSDIVREMFSYADGMTMSAKKDAFANMGGWLALNNDEWAEQARTRLIMTEGFPTYGGLSGRDLECVAAGLKEIVDEDYLHYRIRSIQYITEKLDAIGVPVMKPGGGHAVFVDARKMLPHIPALQYPAQALAVELYITGGIRGVEIGSFMFGRQPDGSEVPAAMELVRLAMPRRVYTQSQADYLIECFEEIYRKAGEIKGMEVTWEPGSLRHFTSRLKPLDIAE
ncbi:MAG: tryptophanase [Halieaceae bacterium]|jgi:tyrosine phenol-lyase|nr:tryptophanase [Halieaceae bacterium]